MNAKAAIIVTLCLLSAVCAAVATQWRADAVLAQAKLEYEKQIATLKNDMAQLTTALERQNQAVALMDAQTKAAEAAKAKAQRLAAEQAAHSARRISELQTSIQNATTAGDVLTKYWGLAK